MYFKQIITSKEELRAILGHPNEIVTRKTINYINEHYQEIIKSSPFTTITTSDLEGNLDVLPKATQQTL